jgi:hypothetical protein
MNIDGKRCFGYLLIFMAVAFEVVRDGEQNNLARRTCNDQLPNRAISMPLSPTRQYDESRLDGML